MFLWRMVIANEINEDCKNKLFLIYFFDFHNDPYVKHGCFAVSSEKDFGMGDPP